MYRDKGEWLLMRVGHNTHNDHQLFFVQLVRLSLIDINSNIFNSYCFPAAHLGGVKLFQAAKNSKSTSFFCPIEILARPKEPGTVPGIFGRDEIYQKYLFRTVLYLTIRRRYLMT
jgi:hypothetical protein